MTWTLKFDPRPLTADESADIAAEVSAMQADRDEGMGCGPAAHEYLVVGEGTKRRVYLTGMVKGAPRFAAGTGGRTNSTRFTTRAQADTAAAAAQQGDRYGYTWTARIA